MLLSFAVTIFENSTTDTAEAERPSRRVLFERGLFEKPLAKSLKRWRTLWRLTVTAVCVAGAGPGWAADARVGVVDLA